MRSLPRTSVLVFSCLSLLPIAAQQARPILEVHTSNGQTTFHIGERIPLILSFTGPDNKQYSITNRSYDRSGRLDLDAFTVTPVSGWSDPLSDYFSEGIFMGGGLFNNEELSSKPIVIQADLNEHIRFDQPGIFIVTVTSHRMGKTSRNNSPEDPPIPLTSNPIELHIIPATPEWQKEKLRSILAVLDKPVKPNESSQERVAAIADLRFLASPGAIDVLAANLREDREDEQNLEFECGLGLAALPDSMRDAGLQAMTKQIDDPHFPVSNWFLNIMAGLEAAPQESPEQLHVDKTARLKTAWQAALSGLARKEGQARASTADALLGFSGSERFPDAGAQVATILAASFLELPPAKQLADLQYDWDNLRVPAMLPVLQALLKPSPPKEHAINLNVGSARELHSIALLRWFDLDPNSASSELLDELGSGRLAFDARSIASLPGDALPQFEARWAHDLVQSDDDQQQIVLAALLVRFGTGSATPQVENELDKRVGKWACAPQAAALAYIVKFDTDAARRLLPRATIKTPETSCYLTLFSEISAYAHGPALNEAALVSLHNKEPRAAVDAADYLWAFGTEAAQKPLHDRYIEWTEAWAGKAKEFDSLGGETSYAEKELGQTLGMALIANQGWLANPAVISEVLRRCVGEEMCNQIRQRASEAASTPPQVTVHHINDYEGYQIAQYSTKSINMFEAKIAQFPKGTKFTLIPTSPQNEDQKKLEHEAEALFTKHGMTLEFPAPPPIANASVQ